MHRKHAARVNVTCRCCRVRQNMHPWHMFRFILAIALWFKHNPFWSILIHSNSKNESILIPVLGDFAPFCFIPSVTFSFQTHLSTAFGSFNGGMPQAEVFIVIVVQVEGKLSKTSPYRDVESLSVCQANITYQAGWSAPRSKFLSRIQRGGLEDQVVNNHGNRESSKDQVVGPLPNGHSWLINGGDPNHLLTGMILQGEIRLFCVWMSLR